MFAANNQKMSAIGNAVKLALSGRRAEFETEVHRIEGEVNKQLGGVGSLSAGLPVYLFVLEIEAELRNRGQIAREALGKAIDLQKLTLRQETVERVKEIIQEVWSEEIADLCGWYQKRVLVDDEIAEQRPFEPSAETAVQGVFVDMENRALAPGFLGRNKDKILVGIIMMIVGIFLGNC